MTVKDLEIVQALRNFKICWLCHGVGKISDLDNNRPWILVECPDCKGKGYYKKD